MPPEKDYAEAGRPNFQGPLGIGDASRAAKEAADKWQAVAARVLEWMDRFEEKWGWLLLAKKK